jgi:choline kinase
VGFEAEQVRAHVARRRFGHLRVRLIENERYAETNNLYSLSLALDRTRGAVTIVNGDDLFNGAILEGLLADRSPAAAVVDVSRPLPGDAMKVTLDGRRVTSLGKEIPDHLAAGNAIGLYRFGGGTEDILREEIRRWVVGGQVGAFYVAAINALAPRVTLGAVSTAGLTWCEVDDAADLAAAQIRVAQIRTEEARQPLSAAWHDAGIGAQLDARPGARKNRFEYSTNANVTTLPNAARDTKSGRSPSTVNQTT